MAIGLGAALLVVYLVIRGAIPDREGPATYLVITIWAVLVPVLGRVTDGMVSGRYAGRPLDLPRARMIRDAARYYGEVSSWTSPLTAEEALGRLIARMRVPQARMRAYDGALWIRFSQRHRTPSAADPTQDVAVTAETEVMVFLDDLSPGGQEAGPDVRSVITAHHQLRRAAGPVSTLLDDPRGDAAMTDHLLIAIRDATGG